MKKYRFKHGVLEESRCLSVSPADRSTFVSPQPTSRPATSMIHPKVDGPLQIQSNQQSREGEGEGFRVEPSHPQRQTCWQLDPPDRSGGRRKSRSGFGFGFGPSVWSARSLLLCLAHCIDRMLGGIRQIPSQCRHQSRPGPSLGSKCLGLFSATRLSPLQMYH